MNTDERKTQRDSLRESYNRSARARDASEFQEWKAQVRNKFLTLLKAEERLTLLEIGSGPGRDSLFFRDQGMQPTCIDLSPAMIELCLEKGLQAFVMDMTEISFPDASFDAAYAMNSLLHLPKAEFPTVLREIKRVLKPGGVAFLGVYGGYDHEGVWEKDSLEPKRFFSFFTDEHLQQEVANIFEILSFDRVIFTPDDPIHFQALVVRKAF